MKKGSPKRHFRTSAGIYTLLGIIASASECTGHRDTISTSTTMGMSSASHIDYHSGSSILRVPKGVEDKIHMMAG